MDLISNVKGIVLDLDGTLLNSQKEVSKRNLQAIRECYRNEITVIFATARPPALSKSVSSTGTSRHGGVCVLQRRINH